MNSPYFYRPQPSMMRAADDVFLQINSNTLWQELFSQGKMLGVLIYSREPLKYICAYSGVINGLEDPDHFFVPPIYNLQDPDDFYLKKDAEISEINAKIAKLLLIQPSGKTTSDGLDDAPSGISTSDRQDDDDTLSFSIKKEITELKDKRKRLSIDLQMEIFQKFDVLNRNGKYKNIVQIFEDSRHRLPPGGTGECAAPRLLQYAFAHQLEPLELAEFWYGKSPNGTLRVHGQFYPSCIEKCSPLLQYMTEGIACEKPSEAEFPVPIPSLQVVYEDDQIIVVDKPAGALSVPGKMQADSIEQKLHELHPMVKGPMLVHRLDQSTSGLLLAAKDADTHKKLQQDFETRKIHKEYVAWVSGIVKSQCGTINLPICSNPEDRPRQIVDFVFGKPALTYYEVLERRENATLIRFSPLTGRTHQLRLHAASTYGLGHSIVGDRIYAGETYPRLLLHAQSITFNQPITGEEIKVEKDPLFPILI